MKGNIRPMAESNDKPNLPEKAAKEGKKFKPSKPVREKRSLKASVAKFFREYKSEFKKIVWPSPKQTTRNTAVVIGVIVVMGTVIALLDLGFTQGLLGLAGIFKPH